ncbi:AI-2E family transporter [Liberiplasma polymorphum]|uniref:AI-2E family transporter n=1 Tax=Liberiplasma polymorphum TaxID=3374570 RepID=UPI0037717371
MKAFIAILLPFSIALFISYLVAPVFKLLEKRIKQKNRLINTVLVFSGITVLLILFGRFAGLLIYEQGIAFLQNDWPRIIDYFQTTFNEDSIFHPIYLWIEERVTFGDGEPITVDIFRIFQSITTIIITIVLVPVFLFFILNDRERIFESLISVIPKKYRVHAIELSKRANQVVENYFNGRFISMFVMAIFFTIVFFILGFKERSVLFGFMLGFFDVVPYVGPFIAIILPVLYSFTERDTLMFGQYAPLAILIINIIGQMIQNNIAQPLFMAKETKIHPLLVLSAFVFFGYLFGVVGLILAIPITGTIKSTLLYVRELNEEKLLLDKEEMKKIREAKE